MNAREEWLKARQTGIGGTDIGAIIGVSKFATAVDVWQRKLGTAPDKETTEAMYWGTVLEDVVAHEYQRRNGVKVQRVKDMLRHPEHNWMLANIDRGIVCPEISGTVRWKNGRLTTRKLLEVKTANAFAASEWGEEGSDELPLTYNAQSQWYMGVTGAEECAFAVLIGGSDYREYLVKRDDELIEHLIEQGRRFWFDHVLTGVAPDPVNAEDLAKLYPKHEKPTVEAGDDEHAAYLRLLGVRKEIAELTEIEEELVFSLKKRMEDNAVLAWNGSTLATWKANKDSKKTDWEAVAKELGRQVEPDYLAAVTEAHTKVKPGARPFKVVALAD